MVPWKTWPLVGGWVVAGAGAAGGGLGAGCGEGEGVAEGAVGPLAPKEDDTCSTKAAGHSTARNFTLSGSPLCQPQEAKSLQPLRKSAGSSLQSSAHSDVSAQRLHQLPSASLWPWFAKPVPGRMPQTLAVDHCRLSKPGAATSKCGSPAPQPLLHGGQRFFFMTTAVQSGCRESGFCTSAHLPQPPTPPSLGSSPQQPSSGPMRAERASEAAPVSHIFSPYSGPPKSAGSCGP
mmetsp:Transcript_108614/g.350632  ORF Transcript_108614/g.350632 Transcript_108614/m.350632 type:complete len:234 (-) Transcript_108614:165-866(-)